MATETGCRGRELLRGGESFGGGAIILAWSRLLLVGVTRDRGAAFRVTPPWVGVLALEVGVFARLVGVPALDIRPFVGGLLKAEGELDRVDEGVVSLGLPSFLTERGSLEADPPPAAAVLEVVPFREGVLREGGGPDWDLGISLCDRVWPLRAGSCADWSSTPSPLRLRYQVLGDEGSATSGGSDRLLWWLQGWCRLDSDVLRGRTPSMP